MGITWEWHEHIGGGLGGGGHAPYITCDGCGKKIENGMGKVVWERVSDPQYKNGEVHSTGQFWVFAKGTGHEACDDKRQHPWQELDRFILDACHNIGIDLAAAGKQAKEDQEKFGL